MIDWVELGWLGYSSIYWVMGWGKMCRYRMIVEAYRSMVRVYVQSIVYRVLGDRLCIRLYLHVQSTILNSLNCIANFLRTQTPGLSWNTCTIGVVQSPPTRRLGSGRSKSSGYDRNRDLELCYANAFRHSARHAWFQLI